MTRLVGSASIWGVSGLHPSLRKEHFSLAYVEALAYAAGYTVDHAHVDVFGVDFEMRDRAFRVDVQMKCVTEDPKPGETVAYDLDVRTYDLLTDPGRILPAYLFVLEVPPDIENWLSCGSDSITMFRCAYYADMSALEQTSNTTSRRVHIDRGNRLTVESLDKLMRESRG